MTYQERQRRYAERRRREERRTVILIALLFLVITVASVAFTRSVWNECRNDGHSVGYCLKLVSD